MQLFAARSIKKASGSHQSAARSTGQKTEKQSLLSVDCPVD